MPAPPLPEGFTLAPANMQTPALPEGFSLDKFAHFDFSGAPQDVRARIATLSPEDRPEALKRWAKARIANPQTEFERGIKKSSGAGSVMQGAGFGIMDELGAAVDTGIGSLKGDEASYDENLALRRTAIDQFEEAHPVVSLGGQIATGLIVPGGAARGATSVAGRLARMSAAGGTQGFAYHVGSQEGGEGTLEQQFAKRTEGGTLPTVIGAVGGPILGGAAEGVRAVRQLNARGLGGLRPKAAAEAQIISDLPGQSVDDFGNQLAIGAYRTNQPEIMQRDFRILGEEMVRANGNRQVAEQAAIQRIMAEGSRTGLPITEATARGRVRNIAEGHDAGDLYISEYPSVAAADAATRNKNSPNIDTVRQAVDTPLIDDLAYVGTSAGARGSSDLRTNLTSREVPQRQGMRDYLSGRVQGRGEDDVLSLVEKADEAASLEYAALHANPNAVNLPKLHGLLQVAVKKHYDEMLGSNGEQREALAKAINELIVDNPAVPGQRLLMPTLKQAQQGRQAIRGMIERNKRAGNTHLVATLQPLYDDVTRAMQNSSTEWSKVNAKWADNRLTERALEFGEALTGKAGPAQRQALREFSRLAPEAQEVFRIGWVQQMLDKIDNMPDGHDVAKLFKTDATRNLFRILFGKREAAEFARRVRNLQVAQNTKQRAIGGSPTLPRQELHKAKDAGIGAAISAQNASIQDLRHWIIEMAISRFKAAKVGHMGRVLSTPAGDPAAAAMRVEQLRRRQAAIARARGPRGTAPGRISGTTTRQIGEQDYEDF